MHGVETRDKAVDNSECTGSASCSTAVVVAWAPVHSRTCVTGRQNGSTLIIGQRVTANTPGLTAPDMRTSNDERTDGAACSRGH